MTQPAFARPQESHISVSGGKVTGIQTWVDWNKTPWPTTTILRCADGFFIDNGDPEHGGASKVAATLPEALAGFHPTIRDGYIALFELENPTEADLARLNFARHRIIYH